MEDDDEFGDLYTDVLKPLEPSASHQPPPASSHLTRPIDLNLQSEERDSFGGGTQSDSNLSRKASDQTLAHDSGGGDEGEKVSAPPARVPEREGAKSPEKTSDYANCGEIGDGGDDGEMKFDIEDGDADIEPVIPGLSSVGGGGELVSELAADQETVEDSATILKNSDQLIGGGQGGERERDDWDSDSDDDLQIVLNDNNRHVTMGPERGAGGGEDDDDDDDEDPLVIVADVEPNHAMEEQEWGDDAVQDSERKEGGEAGKGSGGAAAGPKIGYSNHVYHPFHSQFKYVRPGAAPTSGGATPGPGGLLGQVRPPVNMGPIGGRGRGDWRPPGMKNAPLQKGFHSGFGMPWGGNAAGRGFGGGLEFTLPSHKTIFEVDIDAFEEKPWKYPGVDVTDFFNFGLNEESWKDYCKQLEQRRLETTMQSRIRVYESGRTEQEYDPDLPPELAAATAIRDVQADTTNSGKLDTGRSDLVKEPARLRPPLPPGRAIQVETGYGERLPSIDTRPPRIRDCDAIIEIVCQDSLDDENSTRDGMDRVENDLPGEELREDCAARRNVAPIDAECSNGYSDSYDVQRREVLGRAAMRNPSISSIHSHGPEGDGRLPCPTDGALQCPTGSRGESPVYPHGRLGTPHDERRTHGRPYGGSPVHSERHRMRQDKQEEDVNESRDGSLSLRSSSPATRNDSRSPSVDCKDTRTAAKRGSLVEDEVTYDKSAPEVKLSRPLEDGMEDSQAERSSENSKARSGSSRDYQKLKHGLEDEVIQARRYGQAASNKKHLDENDQHHHRRYHDGRQEMEKARVATKGREGSSSHRELGRSLAYHPYMKTEDFDRRKEREVSDGIWRRRDDDPYSRKARDGDSRKRDRGDDLSSRHKGKTREVERSNLDEHLHSRKHADYGSLKAQDSDSRHKEKDDHLKNRCEVGDDYHNKRRKDEEYLRRTRADKEETLHSQRESSSRLKRERENMLDQQKREVQQRSRDSFDDHRSLRHKDELHFQRDGNERRREREEWHKSKQTQDDVPAKRERERRAAIRSQHGSEDRGVSRLKDEYKGFDKDKDTVPHVEQRKRRDQMNDESSLQNRGHDSSARSNQPGYDEGKSRQQKSGSRNDQNALENKRIQEKKHKESSRKNREPGNGDISASLRTKGEGQSGNNKEMALNGTKAQGNGNKATPVHLNSSGKNKEDGFSDDEQQDSKRGRSKLERWNSRSERDYTITSKSSAALKFQELDRNNNGGSSEASKLADKTMKAHDSKGNEQPHSEEKVASGAEGKDAAKKPLGDWHLDTVEKLKKRSERFKLPMPNDKDASVIKKMENEPLPSAKTETPADTEVKPERPARKRRWTSN